MLLILIINLHKYFSFEKIDGCSPSIACNAAESLECIRCNITDFLTKARHVLVDKLKDDWSLFRRKSLCIFPALQCAIVERDSKIFGKFTVWCKECFCFIISWWCIFFSPLIATRAILQWNKPCVLDMRECAYKRRKNYQAGHWPQGWFLPVCFKIRPTDDSSKTPPLRTWVS